MDNSEDKKRLEELYEELKTVNQQIGETIDLTQIAILNRRKNRIEDDINKLEAKIQASESISSNKNANDKTQVKLNEIEAKGSNDSLSLYYSKKRNSKNNSLSKQKKKSIKQKTTEFSVQGFLRPEFTKNRIQNLLSNKRTINLKGEEGIGVSRIMDDIASIETELHQNAKVKIISASLRETRTNFLSSLNAISHRPNLSILSFTYNQSAHNAILHNEKGEAFQSRLKIEDIEVPRLSDYELNQEIQRKYPKR